jgi:hypothetical protein
MVEHTSGPHKSQHVKVNFAVTCAAYNFNFNSFDLTILLPPPHVAR